MVKILLCSDRADSCNNKLIYMLNPYTKDFLVKQNSDYVYLKNLNNNYKVYFYAQINYNYLSLFLNFYPNYINNDIIKKIKHKILKYIKNPIYILIDKYSISSNIFVIYKEKCLKNKVYIYYHFQDIIHEWT